MTTYDTVTVRPITFAEIEALAERDAEPVEIYLAEESRRHGLIFTPATLTPNPKTGKAFHDAAVPHAPLHAMEPNDHPNPQSQWREAKDHPVGHVVSCSVETMFGTSTGVHLFTSPEAERTAAEVRGWADPASGRTRVYVADAKGGREERLNPVFGSQVSTGFIVEGVDAVEARERAETVLRAEFGDAMRPAAKFQSRPVPDRRVNVFSAGPDRTPLALNVLDSEVSYYMRTSAATVEEVDPAAPQIVVG